MVVQIVKANLMIRYRSSFFNIILFGCNLRKMLETTNFIEVVIDSIAFE
jgi:hypothetical protein